MVALWDVCDHGLYLLGTRESSEFKGDKVFIDVNFRKIIFIVVYKNVFKQKQRKYLGGHCKCDRLKGVKPSL